MQTNNSFIIETKDGEKINNSLVTFDSTLSTVDVTNIKIIVLPSNLPMKHDIRVSVKTLSSLLGIKVEFSDALTYIKSSGKLSLERWMSEEYRIGENNKGNGREVFFRDGKESEDAKYWEKAYVIFMKFKADIENLRLESGELWSKNTISAYCQRATTSKDNKDDE